MEILSFSEIFDKNADMIKLSFRKNFFQKEPFEKKSISDEKDTKK